jgi:hypothetical protein
MKRSLSLTVIGWEKIEELRVKAAAERDPAVAARAAAIDSSAKTKLNEPIGRKICPHRKP